MTLLPAFLCFVYFVGGVPVYWLRRPAVAREPRIEARSTLIPKWLIYYLLWAIAPVEKALIRGRASPNLISSLGLGLSLTAGVTLSRGRFDAGGWLYLFAGIVDLLDGRVARATGRVSHAGAFFDSVADRYAEGAVFAGLWFYYRQSWVGAVVLFALFGSLMVSYVRSRAEAVGAVEPALLGAMQRPERIFLLGIALAASPFLSERLAVGALVLLAATSHLTALGRARAVFVALRSRDQPPPASGSPPACTATQGE